MLNFRTEDHKGRDAATSTLTEANEKANHVAAVAAAQYPFVSLHRLLFAQGRLVAVDEQPADVLFVDCSSSRKEGMSTDSDVNAIFPSNFVSAPHDESILEDLFSNNNSFAPSPLPDQPRVFVLRVKEALASLEQARAQQYARAATSTTSALKPSASVTLSDARLFLVSEWQVPGSAEYEQHFGSAHHSGGVRSFRLIQSSRNAAFDRLSAEYILHSSRPHAQYPITHAAAVTRAKSKQKSLVSILSDSTAPTPASIDEVVQKIWAHHQQQQGHGFNVKSDSAAADLLMRLQRMYALDDGQLWTVLKQQQPPVASIDAPKLAEHVEYLSWDIEMLFH